MGGCCSRLCKDLRLPFFALEEEPYGTIDLDKSFCLNEHSTCFIKFLKLIIFGFVFGFYIHSFVTRPFPYFFMAYLTNWQVLFQVVYLFCSLCTTLFSNAPQWTVRSAWLMASLQLVFGLIVTSLFWTTEYNPDYGIDFYTLNSHLTTFVLCLIETFLINRVPVRLKHTPFVMLWAALFVAWTIIFTVLGIDNPGKPDDVSQALYVILDWEEKPTMAAIVSVLVVFVGIPLVQLLFWALSLCRRCYVEEEESNDIALEQMEEGYVQNKDGEDSAENLIS
mmetsp:Transcript_10700/g.16396  ORF Transcript_10700/g.16396 Transcript_10700/m.16396 type:complete len:279 (+) Transcript_10700:137-973(+)|eukprot:CAMPEP_0178916058 /NCGR_PEP_ID=MMETSP0786-20121207/12405_1 /TAXON_ID=186022 /ORGANISM="Thalassionema frauenfeldii, Strain CCMP 1798" /LENGTH=278 /DNA_ID=CAMNT_0020589305 /DNA_START=131 /DNA_END=967 /DNA_ORIENTATION=+